MRPSLQAFIYCCLFIFGSLLSLAPLTDAKSSKSTASIPTGLLSLSLILKVNPDDWHDTLNDFNALLELVKEKKMVHSTESMIRTARDKVQAKVNEIDEALAYEAAEAKRKAEAEAAGELLEPEIKKHIFTESDIAVKNLKPGMAAPTSSSTGKKKKKNKRAIKRFASPHDFNQAIDGGHVDWSKPFLITDGVNELDALQENWTARQLMKLKNVKIPYLAPLEAKQQRTFDVNQQQEQYERRMIALDRYFVNCFNLKAKPDFMKSPGSQTEHCQQRLNAQTVLPSTMKDYEFGSFERLPWTKVLDDAKADFVSKLDLSEFSKALPEHVSPEQLLNAEVNRQVVIGSSGSGDQLRQAGSPFVDGLVYGRRRWLFIDQDSFATLREKAKEVLEAASGFVFFEQQLTELIEDFGLGTKKMPYWETNQEEGDILYVPGHLIIVDMALQDSISYFQKLAVNENQALGQINGRIWAPHTGVIPNGFRAAFCYDMALSHPTLQTLSNTQIHPQQAQIVSQIMAQNFGADARRRNVQLFSIIQDCGAVMGAGNLINSQRAVCPHIWEACMSSFNKNMKELNLPELSWPPKSLDQIREFGINRTQDMSLPVPVPVHQPQATTSLDDDQDDDSKKVGKKSKRAKSKSKKKKRRAKDEL